LLAIVTDCAIGPIGPFPAEARAALNGREATHPGATSDIVIGHLTTKNLVEVSIEVLEKCLDRLALVIDRAGKRGTVNLPIYERIEAELDALRAKEERMERARQRLK
jgi:hypothetical protein